MDGGASFGTPEVVLPSSADTDFYFPSLEADTSPVSRFVGSLYMSTAQITGSITSVSVSYRRPGIKGWTIRTPIGYKYPDMVASSDQTKPVEKP